jgi:hypothetical protein
MTLTPSEIPQALAALKRNAETRTVATAMVNGTVRTLADDSFDIIAAQQDLLREARDGIDDLLGRYGKAQPELSCHKGLVPMEKCCRCSAAIEAENILNRLNTALPAE